MDKLTIFLDEQLKAEMAQYEVDWTQVCIEAITAKIKTLKNDYDLFDSDIEVDVQENKQQNDIPPLDQEFYETFKRVWKEYYNSSESPFWDSYLHPPKPPTSKQLKDLWKLWYNPYFDQGGWYNTYDEKIHDSQYEKSLNKNTLDQWRLFKNFAQEWGEDLDDTAFGEFVTKFVYEGKLLNITELDPFKFNHVMMEEKDDLPDSSGIYFVVDTNNIYYIGMSKNIKNRWYSHHRQSDFDKYPSLKISYLDSLPVKFLKSIETKFIQHFKPLLNIKENPLLKSQ